MLDSKTPTQKIISQPYILILILVLNYNAQEYLIGKVIC